MSFPMPAPVPMMPPPPGNFGMPDPAPPAPYDPRIQMASPEITLPVINTEPPDPWPGYKPPPKPKVSDVLEAAERERILHQGRIEQGLEMARRFNLDDTLTGVFLRDRDAAATGEVEKFQDPAIRNEIDAICTFLAKMDWTCEALYRMSIDREEAAAKEDGCAYLSEIEQRQHARSGNATVKWRKVRDLLIYGMVAEFNGVDVDNAECGITMRLIQPVTIFPIWEGERGLGQVYRKYQLEAARFIGTFGNHAKFQESVVRKSAGGTTYDPNFRGEVVEYWDRHWCMICWEGKAVLTWEHGRKEVPFVIMPGNFGGALDDVDPELGTATGTWTRATTNTNYKYVYQPFLQREIPLHMFKEAVIGKTATYFRKAANGPKNVFADVLDYEEGFTYDNRESAVNKFRQDTRVEDGMGLPDPQISQAVFGAIMQGESTSRPSSLMAGNAPMSQGSGTALNLLGEAGLDKWMPVVMALEQFETMNMEMRLGIWRDYGDVLGMDGNRGVIPVPRTKPNPRTGESAAHEVTPDLLKSTGIRVNVTFSHFDPATLPTMAQGVIMAKSGGLMSDRSGIKIIGHTTDIDAEMEEITRQKLNETPAVTIMHTVRMLIDEVRQAEARGDAESMEDKLADLMFVIGRLEIEQTSQEIQLMQMRLEKTRMQTIGGMGQPAPGMGQFMPGVQGMGGGMAGMNPGTAGGNLPGPNGPQMNPAGGGMPPMLPPGPPTGGF